MNITHHKKIDSLIFLLLIIATGLGSFATIDLSTAQSSEVIRWSKEEIVTHILRAMPQSFFPVIAADNYGTVHVFWTVGEGINYSYKKNGAWSQPTDVVWGEGKAFTYPAVIIDQNEVLHLFWTTWGEIFHKSVPARDAGKIQAWSEEQVVAEFGGTDTPIRVTLDSQNKIHLVFSDWYGKYGKTVQGNVFHVVSFSDKPGWSEPVMVSDVPRGDLATDPRIAIDLKDKIHIAWGQMMPSMNGKQQGVFYSRLSKDGDKEIIQKEIDVPKAEEKWMMSINVAATKNNQVNLIWVCGVAERCYTWSTNGGDNWREPQRVFEGLIGLSGWDALILDKEDNLYWLTVLRYPQALYSSKWMGTNWQDPPDIASIDSNMQMGENINATTNLGNQIHVVVQLGGNIIYMKGISSALGNPTRIPPTLAQENVDDSTSAVPTKISTAVMILTQTQIPITNNYLNRNDNSNSQLIIFFLGIASPVLLLVIFGFIRLNQRK